MKTLLRFLIAFLSAPATIFATQNDLFDSIAVTKNKITLEITKNFSSKYFLAHTLEFIYADEINLEGLDVSIINAGALMCIAPMVWVSNQDYYVDVMDSDLYESFNTIRHVFKLFYPQQKWLGRIIPRTLKQNIIKNPKDNNHAIILFSGGLDSTCTSFENLDKQQLLVTLNGKDINLSNPEAWDIVYANCQEYAKTYGHQITYATFNLDKIINHSYLDKLIPEGGYWWSVALGTLSHIGAAFPLAYLGGYTQFLIGASRTIERPDPFGNHPLIDNNLRCGGVQVVHDGGEYTRPEKVEIILNKAHEFNVPTPQLRVCQKRSGYKNCCKCVNKCLPMINDLWALGVNPPDYGFALSAQKVIALNKDYLTNAPLTQGTCWRLGSTKQFIQRGFATSLYKNFKPEVREYLAWLMNFDLTKYIHKDSKSDKTKKKFYTHLWKLAYDDPKKELMTLQRPVF